MRSYLSWIDGHPDEAALIFTITHCGINASTLEPDKQEPLARLAVWSSAQVQLGEVKPLLPAIVELVLVGPLSEFCRRRMHRALPDDPQFAAQVAEALAAAAHHVRRTGLR